MDIPIVVATYNRPASLNRILISLNSSKFSNSVKLYISIDGGGVPEVLNLAKEFHWKHGVKEVIHHDRNLGLRNHILSCGDISQQHDAIVLFEDDIFVSPIFYSYTLQAFEFYKNEKNLAGISLYSHSLNETTHLRFLPINDGYDVFFMQLASSWGQCWTKSQWQLFRSWYKNNQACTFSESDGIPIDVVNWPEKSWKKYFIKYMIDNNLFFAYPNVSLSTNFGDCGENHIGVNNFQVPINYGKSKFIFPDFSASSSKYDCYCEILPKCLNTFCNYLGGYPYEVDLYGIKPLEYLKAEYILTSRLTSNSIFSFAKKMQPHEANIIANIKGKDLHFSKIEDVDRKPVYYSIEQIIYFHILPDWHKKNTQFLNIFRNLHLLNNELITIITPVLNNINDIESCLQSVAQQTYTYKEHWIIDGGSTDGTLEIIQKFAQQYDYIKWVSEKDKGIYNAINKGIEKAKGDWIFILGSDDKLINNTIIEDVFKNLEFQEFDVLYGNIMLRETSEILGESTDIEGLKLTCTHHQATFTRKSVFEKLGKYKEKYPICADWAFTIKCFQTEGIKLKYIDRVVAIFATTGLSNLEKGSNIRLKDKAFNKDFFQLFEKFSFQDQLRIYSHDYVPKYLKPLRYFNFLKKLFKNKK
jgi:glycosyltransferase involved in cell wall biosynthesis